jgi:SagB-type dehydrogenase family enzyme
VTIRLEDGRLLVSTDDGRSATLGREARLALRQSVEGLLGGVAADDWDYGSPTASTVGIIAESRVLKPRHGNRALDSQSAQPRSGERVAIGPQATPADRAFHEVLAARRSQRSFTPVTLRDLANVLVPAARVQTWWPAPDGFTATERPTPSAGGRHPIDLAIVANSVTELRPGLWHFDPYTCELVEDAGGAARGSAAVTRLCGALQGGAEPAAAIFAVAHFERTLNRYPGGASLVLRDAGALLATMQLCAVARGLASCIVGTACTLCDESSPWPITDIGALVLGR